MKKIASLAQLQQENPNGLLQIGESIPYAKYTTECYFSGLTTIDRSNNSHEIYRSKSIRREEDNFYQYPGSSKNLLSALFAVQNKSEGDLLVVFVADISTNGHVQATLILTDDAWKKIVASNQKVMRVEQFYLHTIEKQLHVPA